MIVHVHMFGCGYILLSREMRAYFLLDEAYSRTLRNLLPQNAARGARTPKGGSATVVALVVDTRGIARGRASRARARAARRRLTSRSGMNDIIKKRAPPYARCTEREQYRAPHTRTDTQRRCTLYADAELHVPASHTGLIAPSGACIQRQRSLRRSARSRAAQARAGRRPACRRARRSGWLSS